MNSAGEMLRLYDEGWRGRAQNQQAAEAALRNDLRVVLGLVQQLEHHSAFVAALAQGQPVRIKPGKSSPADGPPRRRGRPPGAQNHLTVFASPAEIARLRAELAPLPP